MKKTLLIVIDALASRVIRPALESGRLPHLALLAQAGEIAWNCTSVFPSITPAATASIATGSYPGEHCITGMFHYDRDEDRVHYYGQDFWTVVAHKGMANFFEEFLVKMNSQRLRSETIFERVERSARTAASLNFLVFRGTQSHAASTPPLLRLLPGIPSQVTLPGPANVTLGDFVAHSKDSEQHLDQPFFGGIANRFGFNDDATGEQLLQLAEQGFPNFTLAYFPDNDFNSHELGPDRAVETVVNVDQWIGRLVTQMGGVTELLRHLAIVVTGDHSQSDIGSDRTDAGIDLTKVLQHCCLATVGEPWCDEDDIMVCPNLRAAQVYLHPHSNFKFADLVDDLLAEPRVDQVIWRTLRENENSTYHVATADRGTLRFSPGAGSGAMTDAYGQSWRVDGDLTALAAAVDDDRRLTSAEYPNAFERIALSFDARFVGDFWVTARPGYEFAESKSQVHAGGGSHSSLHVDDSTSPLIVAGAPSPVRIPDAPRIVDVAPICLACLGIDSPLVAGASHLGQGRHAKEDPMLATTRQI